MINLLSRAAKVKPSFQPGPAEAKDVVMTISAQDFPGDEQVAEEIISLLYTVYRDDAEMAYMTFARGSVLMQDAQFLTDDMISRALLSATH